MLEFQFNIKYEICFEFVNIEFSILRAGEFSKNRKELKAVSQMFTEGTKTFLCTFKAYFLTKVYEIWIRDY